MANLEYKSLLTSIIREGERVATRNGLVIRDINLATSFDQTPLVTVRKTAWKNALREFEWFLSGSSNINDLHESVHKWWSPWADKNGEIKNNYSKQFRNFNGVDQIEYLIKTLKTDPTSRRNVITTWNTSDMISPETPITNCHGSLIQVFVKNKTDLHMSMTQRSADIMLGVPHNWIQYWAFMEWICAQTNLKMGLLNWSGGDVHIYEEHLLVALSIVSTDIKESSSKLIYNPKDVSVFKADDFHIVNEEDPIITSKLKMVV